ncbi:hypothetical protein [Lysobacter xanthus]
MQTIARFVLLALAALAFAAPLSADAKPGKHGGGHGHGRGHAHHQDRREARLLHRIRESRDRVRFGGDAVRVAVGEGRALRPVPPGPTSIPSLRAAARAPSTPSRPSQPVRAPAAPLLPPDAAALDARRRAAVSDYLGQHPGG